MKVFEMICLKFVFVLYISNFFVRVSWWVVICGGFDNNYVKYSRSLIIVKNNVSIIWVLLYRNIFKYFFKNFDWFFGVILLYLNMIIVWLILVRIIDSENVKFVLNRIICIL